MQEDWASKYIIPEDEVHMARLDALALAMLAVAALAAVAVPVAIIWWLVESGLWAGVVALAIAIAGLVWTCSIVIRILCLFCCR